jgi:hypothetical protein
VLSVGDPAAPVADVCRWSGAPPNGSCGAGDAVVARVGPGSGGSPTFSRIDPDVAQPTSDEIVAGIEMRPAADIRLRLTGTARRESNLLSLRNVGAPASSYASFVVPDPGGDVLDPSDDRNVIVYDRLPATFGLDRYLLTNTTDDPATFEGLELAAEVVKRRIVLVFGATAGIAQVSAASRGIGPAENDQGILGELEANPNAGTFARGRPFTDRAYTIKVAGVYRFPYEVTLGAVARYQDGQPFARMLVFPALNQGAEAVRAFANGDSRFRFTGTLDVRLQKRFGTDARNVSLLLDAYNVLGLDYDVEELLTQPPDVRIPTAVQPPPAIHLGLRVGF